ncbi:MAG: hypothetical protein M3Q03_18700, partial [Chloroflexota bacterium]|nr:hypothetical protein [Chloroflexota bacterium]
TSGGAGGADAGSRSAVGDDGAGTGAAGADPGPAPGRGPVRLSGGGRAGAGEAGQAAAFAVAHRLKHVYDAHYAVLARLLETELWTADRALLKSLVPAAPWVRWIGDFVG